MATFGYKGNGIRTRGRAGHDVKLLVDMNLSPHWMGVLSEAGIEAMHWSKLGACNCARIRQSWPSSPRTITWHLPTHDLDFSAILAATQGEKLSVVQKSTPRTSVRV
jgi:predicted nuclease of predicted toxin-antitoxin system